MRYQPLHNSSGEAHIVNLNLVVKALQSAAYPPIDQAHQDHTRGLKTSILII